MNREVIDLCQRLADMPWQRGNQVGRLDDRPQPEKARQLQHDVPLDPPRPARLDERHVEVRQQVEPERIGRPDRRALLRPPLPRPAGTGKFPLQ